MDADPPPRTSGSTPATLQVDAGRSSETDVDTAEDPYSRGSLFHSTAPLLGTLIGWLTLIIPVSSVISSRSPEPAAAPIGSERISPIPGERSDRPPALRTLARSDGPAQSQGLTGAGAGEPGGGDPGRQFE